jgi:hypothetical protein
MTCSKYNEVKKERSATYQVKSRSLDRDKRLQTVKGKYIPNNTGRPYRKKWFRTSKRSYANPTLEKFQCQT